MTTGQVHRNGSGLNFMKIFYEVQKNSKKISNLVNNNQSCFVFQTPFIAYNLLPHSLSHTSPVNQPAPAVHKDSTRNLLCPYSTRPVCETDTVFRRINRNGRLLLISKIPPEGQNISFAETMSLYGNGFGDKSPRDRQCSKSKIGPPQTIAYNPNEIFLRAERLAIFNTTC